MNTRKMPIQEALDRYQHMIDLLCDKHMELEEMQEEGITEVKEGEGTFYELFPEN